MHTCWPIYLVSSLAQWLVLWTCNPDIVGSDPTGDECNRIVRFFLQNSSNKHTNSFILFLMVNGLCNVDEILHASLSQLHPVYRIYADF